MTAIVVALMAASATIAGGTVSFAQGATDDGKAVFDQLCKGCHTIGGGRSVGPDLQGLADRRERAWAEQMIVAPEKLIASGDQTAKDLVADYGMQMPNLGVTSVQADALLSYLGFPEATPAPEPTPAPAPEPPAASGDADNGKQLFKGSEDLAGGGPSCLSCHSVAGVGALGGGQIGPDLTGAFAKYGGVQGLRAALKSMPFPTMAPIFLRKPLTPTEQADLTAFLEAAPEQSRPSGAAGKLVGLSLGSAALLGVLALAVWNRRLTGVRKPLVNRSRGK